MRERWPYDELLDACARGEYPSCEVRAASGRANRLLGLTAADLAWLEGEARARRLGLVLLGSRVSGPRSRQRSLHPALSVLPLETRRRDASALDPGADGVVIDKTVIKEHGREDPRTSDLSIALVDAGRSPAELESEARSLEAALNARGWSFPARVFALWDGEALRDHEHFRRAGERYLRSLRPEASFPSSAWRAALAELYLPVNL